MVDRIWKTVGSGKGNPLGIHYWSFNASTITFSGDPDCVGLNLHGTMHKIATDDSGFCIAFDSVQTPERAFFERVVSSLYFKKGTPVIYFSESSMMTEKRH